MQGIDSVVHLAARVHVIADQSRDPLADFRSVNVGGTEAVAACAAHAGVRRMVYVSSIKVLGETTRLRPFQESDEPRPVDPYGVSKLEAENLLHEIARGIGLEVVVIRPPLVYGPGVRGNFLRMLDLAARGLPLPFASISNERSMISVENLCDVILACLSRPEAVGRRFLVSDGEDISTPRLIRMVAAKMGLRQRLLPMPVSLLRVAGKISGHSVEFTRLCDSLQVDISRTQEALAWSAPQSLEEGIETVVAWYRNRQKN